MHCRKIDYGEGKKHFRNVVNSVLQPVGAVDVWERIYQTAICKEQAKRRKVDHGRYRRPSLRGPFSAFDVSRHVDCERIMAAFDVGTASVGRDCDEESDVFRRQSRHPLPYGPDEIRV